MNAIFILVLLWNFQLKEFPPEKNLLTNQKPFLLECFLFQAIKEKRVLCSALVQHCKHELKEDSEAHAPFKESWCPATNHIAHVTYTMWKLCQICKTISLYIKTESIKIPSTDFFTMIWFRAYPSFTWL